MYGEYKRQRADEDEIIAAGLNYSTEETYLSTNIVNVSSFDSTPQHGLPANFTQSRTTQIVANTKRSLVGVAYAEIQSKSLPIFQPQVAIGSDRDALIYEVGTSATWSGCLINPNPKNSSMSTLAFPTSLDTPQEERDKFNSGQATLMYDFSSAIPFKDSYGYEGLLSCIALNGLNPGNTLLRVIFSYWSSVFSDLYKLTPLIPIVIPSVYQSIFRFAPLLDKTTSMPLNKSYVVVESVDGFMVGDKVLVFGTVPNASPTDMKAYYTISSISKYSDMVNGGAVKLDPFLTPNINNMYVIVFDVSTFPGFGVSYASGGYIVNTRVDSIGGRIEFLMDGWEFRSKTATIIRSYNKNEGNYIDVEISGTLGQGFLRDQWKGVVQIETNGIYNGYYRYESAVVGSGMVTARLTPLYTVLETTGTISESVTLKIAPNFFNFDTRVLSYPTDNAQLAASLKFMKYFGYEPTKVLDIPKPQYPPRCTPSVKSWRRAFTPDFFFSAYRGLRWTTQDVDVLPTEPIIRQDFGSDSGSSYYNVYDFRSFINESVNPAFSKILNEPQPTSQVPLSKVTNVSGNAFSIFFHIADTTEYAVGDTIRASGFSDVQFFIEGTVTFLPLDGIYTIQFKTGTTLQCNNPNDLHAFPLDIYNGVINSPTPLYLSDLSLNAQLLLQSRAYQRAFTESSFDLRFIFDDAYQIGDVVIYRDFIYIANTANINSRPGVEQDGHWFVLGPNKNYLLNAGVLTFTDTASGSMFICPGYNDYSQQVRLTPLPQFQTKAISFSLDPVSNLISYTADSIAYGDINGFPLVNRVTNLTGHGFIKDDRNINYLSWGSQNGTGSGESDEYMSIETNSAFKFLFDNFTARSIRYVNPATNGLLIYWIWGSYTEEPTGITKRSFQQSVESLSSCLSPVQSIVILSKTIPVVQTLLSPACVISDINSSVSNVGGVTGDEDSIIGEFFITPGMLTSPKSVIRYQPDHVTFYSLQSTKTFKQVDYNVCYRHRITQKLVPLSLTNYGNINIKFVFKPI